MTATEVARIRKRLGWTQAALGDVVGVHANTIARWERGEMPVSNPALRLMRRLRRDERKGKARGKSHAIPSE